MPGPGRVAGGSGMALRVAVVSSLASALLIGSAKPASAQVTVTPTTAQAGSYPVLTFRVPNESAKARTTAVTITFPTEHPFVSVSVRQLPGWTVSRTTVALPAPAVGDGGLTTTEAVGTLTWQADPADAIALGAYAAFEVSVGPVPDGVASLAFPTTQTYDDGSVVRWDQPMPAAGRAEHPVPTLTVLASPATTTPGATPSEASSGASSPAAAVATPAQVARADDAARTLGVIATIIGALALVVGALAVRRRRANR